MNAGRCSTNTVRDIPLGRVNYYDLSKYDGLTEQQERMLMPPSIGRRTPRHRSGLRKSGAVTNRGPIANSNAKHVAPRAIQFSGIVFTPGPVGAVS